MQEIVPVFSHFEGLERIDGVFDPTLGQRDTRPGDLCRECIGRFLIQLDPGGSRARQVAALQFEAHESFAEPRIVDSVGSRALEVCLRVIGAALASEPPGVENMGPRIVGVCAEQFDEDLLAAVPWKGVVRVAERFPRPEIVGELGHREAEHGTQERLLPRAHREFECCPEYEPEFHRGTLAQGHIHRLRELLLGLLSLAGEPVDATFQPP